MGARLTSEPTLMHPREPFLRPRLQPAEAGDVKVTPEVFSFWNSKVPWKNNHITLWGSGLCLWKYSLVERKSPKVGQSPLLVTFHIRLPFHLPSCPSPLLSLYYHYYYYYYYFCLEVGMLWTVLEFLSPQLNKYPNIWLLFSKFWTRNEDSKIWLQTTFFKWQFWQSYLQIQ